jgi:hypothetical protein
MTVALKPLVAIRPALLIAQKAGPVVIPAAVSQLSTAALTQAGTGTVRTWPPFANEVLEGCKKSLPLFSCQPVFNPHAVFLDAFHAPNAGREIKTEQSAIGGLVGEPANSRKAEVNVSNADFDCSRSGSFQDGFGRVFALVFRHPAPVSLNLLEFYGMLAR